MHTHDHDHEHNDGHHHAHEHADIHSHSDSGGDHHHGGHDGLLNSREEAAAFLQYTLQHNAHHEEELSGLVHSLQHLKLESEAGEIRACIETLRSVNKRLDDVLISLK